ncbi:MAG TPA: hypothetical protein VN673_01850, partial [Clostridia bacterium]|nr:hypothetical protein [Clostridia bacterium]
VIGQETEVAFDIFDGQLTAHIVGVGNGPYEASLVQAQGIDLESEAGEGFTVKLQLDLFDGQVRTGGLARRAETHIVSDHPSDPTEAQPFKFQIDSTCAQFLEQRLLD